MPYGPILGAIPACNGRMFRLELPGMRRANRGSGLEGERGVFHLAHRGYNRVFLLRFARDRDDYRARLREHLRESDISVLDYGVASNHVPLLVDAKNLEPGIAQGHAQREPCETESLAVGSHGFLEKIRPLILSRRETEMEESSDGNVWALQEAPVPYGQERGAKDGSKVLG
jgi:hypothetical protein